MIILNCNGLPLGDSVLRDNFIKLCDLELTRLQKDNNLGLMQLSQIYSLKEIKNAFRESYIANGILQTPENTKSSHILRYLEYGGEDVRPTHLLSIVKHRLYDLVSVERS